MRKPLRGAGVHLSRQRERWHVQHALAGDAQRLAAGGKDTDSRGFLQDDISKDGDGVEEMLAVVEDQKCLAGGEVSHQERGGPLPGLVGEVQARHNGLGNQMRILETSKVDEPHTVSYSPLEVAGCTEGEPGLT